jgi:hypothetical protein
VKKLYKVLYSDDPGGLEKKVEEWMRDGYTPCGGVCMVVFPRTDYEDECYKYVQAVKAIGT